MAGSNLIKGSAIDSETILAANIGSGAATNGQLLTANGSGGATWTTVASGGTIGGTIADNQVAVGNGSDAIDGSSQWIWDGTTVTLGKQAADLVYNMDVASNSVAAHAPAFRMRRARGNLGAEAVVAISDDIGQIEWYGHDGTAYLEIASIRCIVDDVPSTNDMPGRLEFYTTANGASSSSLAMTIDDSQNVISANDINVGNDLNVSGDLIEMSINSSGVTGTCRLFNDDPAGAASFYAADTSVGGISMSYYGGSYVGFPVAQGKGIILTDSTVDGLVLYTAGSDADIEIYTDDVFRGLWDADGGLIVGGSSIDAAAELQVDSTTKGFLPPRMTTTQRNAISSPPNGLIIYNSTTGKHQGYNGSWNDFY